LSWRPWLQLNVKVKIFGYCPINGMVVLPSADVIVLFELELGECLWNAPVWGAKE